MKSKGFILRLSIVLAMIIATLFLYPKLPDIIPTHWNFQGQPDDWGAKTWAAWLIPGISLLMIILFPILAKIDPRHKNYKKFWGVWEIIQTIIIAFFGFIYFIQYYMTLYPENQNLMQPIMLSAVGLLFIVLGNYMGKIRQNYFVGIKTPWTLNDKEVWQKTHRVGGWAFVIAGILYLFEAWTGLFIGPVFIITITGVVVVPIVYSYVISKKN
ncbi:SdpI family protein [Candidatus Peregrinibacteria bacterium]|nr:SdpI family protein [Candidatus Peregrinibacteria bacterium]